MLLIDNTIISRYQINTPTIEFYHSEIASINKTKGGGLIIKAHNTKGTIIIPAQMKSYTELEEELGNIKQ